MYNFFWAGDVRGVKHLNPEYVFIYFLLCACLPAQRHFQAWRGIMACMACNVKTPPLKKNPTHASACTTARVSTHY